MDKFIRCAINNILYDQMFYKNEIIFNDNDNNNNNDHFCNVYVFYGHKLTAGKELREHVFSICSMFKKENISYFMTMPETMCIFITNGNLSNSIISKYKLLKKDNEYDIISYKDVDIVKIYDDIINGYVESKFLDINSLMYKQFLQSIFYRKVIENNDR